MQAGTAKRAEDVGHKLFREVTDTIRDAARIPQDRRLTPEVLRGACEYGMGSIFST